VNKEKKYNSVKLVKDIMLSSSAVIIGHNLGLTVSEFSGLRRSLYECNASCIVLKNTLTRLSLLDTIHFALKEVVKGPTVLICSKDIISISKILVSFSKENTKFVIIAGSVGKGVMELRDINYLAEMPSLDDIRSNLVSIFRFPANRIAGILNAPANRLAHLFFNYSKK